jgi:endonuclease/exonuclease/phosphatase family metal-dependent hydrolase
MSLRIATFNLKDFFLPRNDAERSVAPRKFANLVSNLRRADADIVALQEVGEEQQLGRLVNALADRDYRATIVGKPDKRGIRCAILSRLAVIESHVYTPTNLTFPHFHAGDPEPFAGRLILRRPAVHVRVRVTGAVTGIDEVDVLTAHLKSNLPLALRKADGRDLEALTPHARAEDAMRSLVQRAAEALYLRGLVDGFLRKQNAEARHAVCVLGDFNDSLESLPVRILRGMGPIGAETLTSLTDLVGAEHRYSCFHGSQRTLIDHMLASPNLFERARVCEIYNENLRSHGSHDAGGSAPTDDSDHALCVAHFD